MTFIAHMAHSPVRITSSACFISGAETPTCTAFDQVMMKQPPTSSLPTVTINNNGTATNVRYDEPDLQNIIFSFSPEKHHPDVTVGVAFQTSLPPSLYSYLGMHG